MSKIRAEHLTRRAYVYIRQSTFDQVQHNRESQLRQYGLADRAREPGWPDVSVFDDDLGRSGSGIHRPGFERLLACALQWRDRCSILYRSFPGESNRKLITDNANMKGNMVRGSVKRGSSLLPGLLRCGHCGRKRFCRSKEIRKSRDGTERNAYFARS